MSRSVEAEPEGRETVGRSKPDSRIAAGLHVIATPIGNLGDITLRAIETLQQVDVIACEDTRTTGVLLARHGIATPTTPYHEHNASRVRPKLIERLEAGARIALVSDAGTPLVSDPGYKLVEAAIEAGVAVTACPGPSALLAALGVAGLPTDRFLFAGFLPQRGAARRAALVELADLKATLVFYEAPHRLAESLADMAQALGDRKAAVTRELTKRYEEVRRDRLAALADHYAAAGAPKGEIVVVVGPPEKGASEPTGEDLDERLKALLATMSVREAAAQLAAETGQPRRALYARALRLTRDDDGEGEG
jgi:16S rRNA (cytidine1402-2'-O)-methyltransferase